MEEIERNVRERDKADMSRAISPLRQAADAVVLDNSHMTRRTDGVVYGRIRPKNSRLAGGLTEPKHAVA